MCCTVYPLSLSLSSSLFFFRLFSPLFSRHFVFRWLFSPAICFVSFFRCCSTLSPSLLIFSPALSSYCSHSLHLLSPSHSHTHTHTLSLSLSLSLSRYASQGVYANAVHPGIVASNILSDAHWFIRVVGTPFMRVIGSNTEQGARTSHYVAVSPDLEAVGAKYFMDSHEAVSSDLTYDAAYALRLWQESLRWVNARTRCTWLCDVCVCVCV
jgi:hypothetical protein